MPNGGKVKAGIDASTTTGIMLNYPMITTRKRPESSLHKLKLLSPQNYEVNSGRVQQEGTNAIEQRYIISIQVNTGINSTH